MDGTVRAGWDVIFATLRDGTQESKPATVAVSLDGDDALIAVTTGGHFLCELRVLTADLDGVINP